MKDKHSERYFGPVKIKGFQQALEVYLSREFPQLGGPQTRRLLAGEIKAICDEYYVAKESLKIGQLRWPAVEKGCHSAEGRLMKDTPQKVVALTVISEEDIDKRIAGIRVDEIRKGVIKRITDEAWTQGGVLACNDIAAILHLNHSASTNYVREYEKDHPGETIKRRGNMQDYGPTLTHKEQIIHDYVQKRFSPEIAHRHNHSLKAADRYITNFEKVKEGLKKGMTQEEISHITGMGSKLVFEYSRLVKRYYPALVKKTTRMRGVTLKMPGNGLGDISHVRK
jgi:hypothetical protein